MPDNPIITAGGTPLSKGRYLTREVIITDGQISKSLKGPKIVEIDANNHYQIEDFQTETPATLQLDTPIQITL